MNYHGFIGGGLGYRLLGRFGRHVVEEEQHNTGANYQGQSKLEFLFGKGIWQHLAGKEVIDFGCGGGYEAVEMASRGAAKVTGIDTRQRVLDHAEGIAKKAGVTQLCEFTTETDRRADIIFSIDGFEHYDDPEEILVLMWNMLKPGGQVFVCFGPPWFHPYGGHLFSVCSRGPTWCLPRSP